MLTTEAEAKTKRCQESFPACTQVTPEGSTWAIAYSGGAYAMATAPSFCIGSACMAWRWQTWACYGPDGTFQNVFDGDPPPDGSLMGGDPPMPFTYRRLGYCGKAGKP